jgi:hypothetical protein
MIDEREAIRAPPAACHLLATPVGQVLEAFRRFGPYPVPDLEAELGDIRSEVDVHSVSPLLLIRQRLALAMPGT